MLYLNFTDSTVEALKSTKHFLGKETITGCTRVTLSEGTVEEGKLKSAPNCQKHFEEIRTQLGISGKQDIALSIANGAMLIARFQISSNSTNSQSSKIIEEAKKTLDIDLAAYENFYKIIGTSVDSTTILFTALAKSTIQTWFNFFESCGCNLKVITTRAFSIHEILKPLITLGQRILLADITGKKIEYSVFDKEGAIFTHDKKLLKSIPVELKSYVKKLKEEHNITVDTIYMSGEGSIGENTSDLSKESGVVVVKINDIIDEILTSEKITFDTGGTPKVFYVHSLGLFLHAKNAQSANFIADFEGSMPEVAAKIHEPALQERVQELPEETVEEKKESHIQETEQKEDEPKEDKKEENVTTVETPRTVLPEIIEHKTTSITPLFSAKTFQLVLLFIAVAILAFGLIIVVSSAQQGTLKLPFISQPTLTPSPTLVPTSTPTPTIDPSLKRSDLKVSVQNGTDRTGYAKETADYLESKDYKDVSRSNSQGDYQQSEIHIKDAKRNYLPIIIEDLKEKIDTSKIVTLEEGSQFDAIIILGQK